VVSGVEQCFGAVGEVAAAEEFECVDVIFAQGFEHLLERGAVNPSPIVGQLFEEAKFVQAASGALGL